MKPLYVTAIITFSGKTSLALGIGLKLQASGYKIGYWKPVSTQPFLAGSKLADEDAVFVRRALNLDTPLEDLSTVIIDEHLFNRLMTGKEQRDFVKEIQAAYQKVSGDNDVLLIEGGASMREGYSIGMNTTQMAETLALPTLGVVRYRTGLMLIDDILALQFRIGRRLLGVVINSIPSEATEEVRNKVTPYLERHDVKVYGALPYDRNLMSMSVSELVRIVNAKVLVGGDHGEGVVENLSVGAMSAESALPYFRRSLNKAVITGGDRADIQVAALETSTTALVLTGNLTPNAEVIQRAEELGVAVLLVTTDTMETVEAIEKVFGHSRLSQPEKLDRYRNLLDANLDWNRLFSDLGISLLK